MCADVDFVAARSGGIGGVVSNGDAIDGGDGLTGIEVLGKSVVNGEGPVDSAGVCGIRVAVGVCVINPSP